MAICYPLSACNWLQNEWPRMTLSANFMSKSVFDQQGCRALTFALARLSCFHSVHIFFSFTLLLFLFWSVSLCILIDTCVILPWCNVRMFKKYMLVISALCLALNVRVATVLYLEAVWTCQWLVYHINHILTFSLGLSVPTLRWVSDMIWYDTVRYCYHICILLAYSEWILQCEVGWFCVNFSDCRSV